MRSAADQRSSENNHSTRSRCFRSGLLVSRRDKDWHLNRPIPCLAGFLVFGQTARFVILLVHLHTVIKVIAVTANLFETMFTTKEHQKHTKQQNYF
jgi:hypothetical protein